MDDITKLKIKPRKYGSSTIVSIRMPDKLMERIDKAAEKTNRSRNGFIIKLSVLHSTT